MPTLSFDANATSLGRKLYQRGLISLTCIYRGVAGGAAVIFGCLLVANGVNWGALLVFAGLPVCIWAVWISSRVFIVYEHGVEKKSMFGRRELRYVDISTFSYRATCYYNKDNSTSRTEYELDFIPVSRSSQSRFRIRVSGSPNDGGLAELRDFIADFVAAQMRESLNSSNTVTWTRNLVFTEEGILYRPPAIWTTWVQSLYWRKRFRLLNYADIEAEAFNSGGWFLYEKSQKSPVTVEWSDSVNFYPGRVLLLQMMAERAS